MTDKRIVLVGGCFDVIHYGHIQFLKQARALGDYLVVALESDENVKRRKGESRPIHTQVQRKHMLEAITYVDQVYSLPTMEKDTDYFTLVQKIRPHIIAVTQGDPYLEHKQKQATTIGATVVEIPKIHTPSTTQLAKLLELE
jgi:rfaE bifunctional protein nucleotidyltransferase chain/domain